MGNHQNIRSETSFLFLYQEPNPSRNEIFCFTTGFSSASFPCPHSTFSSRITPTTDTPESTLTDADLAWIEDEISYQKIPFITEHNLLVTRVGQLTSEYSEMELDIKAIDDEVEEIKNNQPCVDTVDGKFEDSKKGGKLVKCNKILNADKIEKYCKEEGDQSAREVCPVSCETCTGECVDTLEVFYLDKEKTDEKYCSDITIDGIWFKNKYCRKAKGKCPLSCDEC